MVIPGVRRVRPAGDRRLPRQVPFVVVRVVVRAVRRNLVIRPGGVTGVRAVSVATCSGEAWLSSHHEETNYSGNKSPKT